MAVKFFICNMSPNAKTSLLLFAHRYCVCSSVVGEVHSNVTLSPSFTIEGLVVICILDISKSKIEWYSIFTCFGYKRQSFFVIIKFVTFVKNCFSAVNILWNNKLQINGLLRGWLTASLTRNNFAFKKYVTKMVYHTAL